MRGIKMTEDYIFHDEDLHDQIIAMDNTLTKKATKFSVENRGFFISHWQASSPTKREMKLK